MNIIKTIFSLIARLGLILRIIMIFGAYMLIRDGIRDMNFLNSYKQRKSFTIEELSAMKAADIPRYLTVDKCLPTGQGVIQTFSRRRGGTSKTYIYPVLSLTQLVTAAADTTGATKPVAKIVFKKSFSGSEDALTSDSVEIKKVEGLYDDDGLDAEVRKLLEEDGYKIDDAPIVISEGGDLPTYNRSLLYTGLGALLGFLALGSFWWQIAGAKKEEAANPLANPPANPPAEPGA